MAQNYPVRSRGGWYLARMGRLEWQETILKLGAIAIGITTFVLVFSTDRLALPDGLRLVQFAILATISLGLFGAIFERLDQKEIGAMVFVLLNNLGHWGLLLSLASGLSGRGLVIAFSILMLAGDLTIRNAAKALVFTIVSLFALGYAVILALEFFA